jgi:hypothetical protein
LFLIIAISVIAFEFNEDSGILPATYGGGGEFATATKGVKQKPLHLTSKIIWCF